MKKPTPRMIRSGHLDAKDGQRGRTAVTERGANIIEHPTTDSEADVHQGIEQAKAKRGRLHRSEHLDSNLEHRPSDRNAQSKGKEPKNAGQDEIVGQRHEEARGEEHERTDQKALLIPIVSQTVPTTMTVTVMTRLNTV